MWSRVDISHHCRDSGVWPPADVHSWLGFEYLLIQMDLFAGWKPNDCDLGKKNEVNWNDAHLDFIFSSQKEHSFNYTHSNAEQNIKVCFWPVSNHRRSWWAGQGQSNSPFWITCSFKRVTFLKQEWEIVTMTELSEAKNRQLLISTPLHVFPCGITVGSVATVSSLAIVHWFGETHINGETDFDTTSKHSPLIKCPSIHCCFTSVPITLYSAALPHLSTGSFIFSGVAFPQSSQLFHHYLGTVARENKASSCFGLPNGRCVSFVP